MWFFWLKNTFAIETIYNNSFDFPDSTSQFIWYWNYSNNVMISNSPNGYWQTHSLFFYKGNSLGQFGTNTIWSRIANFARSSIVKYKDSLLLYSNSSCNNYWAQWFWYYTVWYDGWGIYNFTNSWFILKSDSVSSSNSLWYFCSWYWRQDFRFFLNNGLIFSQNWWSWKRLNNNNIYDDYTWPVPEQLFPHFGKWKIWYSTNNFLFYSDSINELKYIKYFEYSAWVYTSTGTINLSNYWLSLSWNTIDIEKVEELPNEKFKIYFTHNNWLNSQSYIIDTTTNSKLTENQTIFFLWNQNLKINLSWVDYKIWLNNKPLVIPHNDSQNLFKIYKKNWDTKLYFNPDITIPIIDEWGSWWNEDIWWNCYIKDSYQFNTLNDISLYTENINDYTIDVWNNYLTYIKNLNQDEFWLIYDNFVSISYKDSNNNELTGSGIDVLFNTWSYIDLKTSLFWETSFFVYHDKPFNEITIQCKNTDTSKSRFTIYTGQWEKTSILDWNSYTSNEGDFACWDVIKFDQSTSMIKIVVKWFRYNLQIKNIIIKENEISTINNEICFDSTTGTYTKDGQAYEPTDAEKKEIAKNINTDVSDWNKTLQKLFWDNFSFITDIISLVNIILPTEPLLSFDFPIPKLTSSFWITTQSKTIILQQVNDVLSVSEIEKNTISKKFISFIFSLIYIIYRVALISLYLFFFYLYFRVVDKLIWILFWKNLETSQTPSNWFWLIPFLLMGTIFIWYFVSFLVLLSPIYTFITVLSDLWTVFITFFALNLWDYDFFKTLVNTFFALVVSTLLLHLVYRITVKFSRIN